MNVLKEEKVLDRGYVQLLDYMGTDIDIVEAARISTNAESKGLESDRKLIRYLMKHEHTSPFEMVEFKFRIRLPIFVMRQLVRHRTASLNEISGRYTTLSTDFYVPELDRVKGKGVVNRQSSEGEVTHKSKELFINGCEIMNSLVTQYYEVDNTNNIANELSRINLPLSTYTEIVWKIDLRNLLHFLKLRLDQTAQYEIRVYAEAIVKLIKDIVPLTFEAWEDLQLYSLKLSRQELNILKVYIEILQANQCDGSEFQKLTISKKDQLPKKDIDFIKQFLNQII